MARKKTMRPLTWHKQCEANMRAGTDTYRRALETAARDFARHESELWKLTNAIREAEKLGDTELALEDIK